MASSAPFRVFRGSVTAPAARAEPDGPARASAGHQIFFVTATLSVRPRGLPVKGS